MCVFIPVKTRDEDYAFVENLWHESFPPSERRDDAAQRDNVDRCPDFTCYLIADGGLRVGLVTVWHLDGFHYVEHLATSPSVRNRGYGRKIMEALRERFPGLMVLEVEMPEDEWSRRRVGFYLRCGFRLCEKEYVQPPYRKEGMALPMRLMYAGREELDSEFDTVRASIYRRVYGV